MKRKAVAKKVHQDYSVDHPNALWHIDGHHKLILWGIVIHGIADGDSRTVCAAILNPVKFSYTL